MLSVAHNKREEEEFKTDLRIGWLCMHFTLPYLEPNTSVTVGEFMPKWKPEKPKERVVMTDDQIEESITKFVYPMLKAAEGGK